MGLSPRGAPRRAGGGGWAGAWGTDCRERGWDQACWPLSVALSLQILTMTDGLMSKAATMEIPINGAGDTGSLPEDDGLEQVCGLGEMGMSG